MISALGPKPSFDVFLELLSQLPNLHPTMQHELRSIRKVDGMEVSSPTAEKCRYTAPELKSFISRTQCRIDILKQKRVELESLPGWRRCKRLQHVLLRLYDLMDLQREFRSALSYMDKGLDSWIPKLCRIPPNLEVIRFDVSEESLIPQADPESLRTDSHPIPAHSVKPSQNGPSTASAAVPEIVTNGEPAINPDPEMPELDYQDPGKAHSASSLPDASTENQPKGSTIGNPEIKTKIDVANSISSSLPDGTQSCDLYETARPVSGERYGRDTVQPIPRYPLCTPLLLLPPTRSPATPRPPPEPPPSCPVQRARTAQL